jgi:hypothetical protein
MQIRRPIVALITALTLIGGGSLTACGDPVESRTGTPKDTASNTSGSNPSDASQDNLPDNTNPEPTSDQDEDTQDPG